MLSAISGGRRPQCRRPPPRRRSAPPFVASAPPAVASPGFLPASPGGSRLVMPVPDKVLAREAGLYDNEPTLRSARGSRFRPAGRDRGRVVLPLDFEPGSFDPAVIQAELDHMRTLSGHNAVRVSAAAGAFTSPSHGISTSADSTVPIKPANIANVADFIQRAAGEAADASLVE